jgi:hypothetical protein
MRQAGAATRTSPARDFSSGRDARSGFLQAHAHSTCPDGKDATLTRGGKSGTQGAGLESPRGGSCGGHGGQSHQDNPIIVCRLSHSLRKKRDKTHCAAEAAITGEGLGPKWKRRSYTYT